MTCYSSYNIISRTVTYVLYIYPSLAILDSLLIIGRTFVADRNYIYFGHLCDYGTSMIGVLRVFVCSKYILELFSFLLNQERFCNLWNILQLPFFCLINVLIHGNNHVYYVCIRYLTIDSMVCHLTLTFSC